MANRTFFRGTGPVSPLGNILGVSLVLLAEAFLVPALVVGLGEGQALAESMPPETAAVETAAPETMPPDELGWDQGERITLLTERGVEEMTLEDYLWGVVAAEMPASFEEEALKAQAVAARTETLYRQAHPSDAHPEADICTDITCCQAYTDRDSALTRWGASAGVYADKIARAVSGTDGMAVVYEGEVIQALFHSSSDGQTRSSAEVWGGTVPYLTAVTSPEGEEVPNYYSVVKVGTEEFRSAVLAEYPAADLEGTPGDWALEPVYGDSGLLTEMKVGGVTIRASKLRTMFALRSASFSAEGTEDGVTFYVTGYGHGVGMSQYGANAMAKEGAGYEEILEWYYSGAVVEHMAEVGM